MRTSESIQCTITGDIIAKIEEVNLCILLNRQTKQLFGIIIQSDNSSQLDDFIKLLSPKSQRNIIMTFPAASDDPIVHLTADLSAAFNLQLGNYLRDSFALNQVVKNPNTTRMSPMRVFDLRVSIHRSNCTIFLSDAVSERYIVASLLTSGS